MHIASYKSSFPLPFLCINEINTLCSGSQPSNSSFPLSLQKPKTGLDSLLSSKVPMVEHTTVDVTMPDIKIGKKQDDVNIVVQGTDAFDLDKLVSTVRNTKKTLSFLSVCSSTLSGAHGISQYTNLTRCI
jgi:protoporphyrinogen oxidase